MISIRFAFERAARDVVLRRHIRVAGERVDIFASPDSSLCYAKPSFMWDDELIRFAEAHVPRDGDVWDIGANIGVFAMAAAKLTSGRVIAVEPDPFLADLVRRSSAESNLDVDVEEKALGQSSHRGRFHIAERGRSSNAMDGAGWNGMGGIRAAIDVDVVTGDTLLERSRPALIKIDVEGAEISVLRGLAGTLRECKPKLLVEVQPEHVGAVAGILDRYGYAMQFRSGNDIFFS